MNSSQGFIYSGIMKEARTTYKSLGIPLFLFLVLFGLLRDYLLIPLMGKIWGLALATTPDGFISTSNVVNTLLKSPWILLIGAILIVLYAWLAMWQVSAMLLGIGYIRQGQKIGIRDIFRLSLLQIKDRIKKSNWMILFYSLVIVPLANVYQTNDLISRFVIPEYIQDFIENNTILFVLSLILAAALVYLGLRWFFLLPSFILKKKDFREARDESLALTKSGTLKNGINIVLYSFLELLRLSIVPLLLILLPVFLCYVFTANLDFSASLFSTLGITLGLEIVQNITGTLVQVSTMCFLVVLYFDRLEACGLDGSVLLPEPRYLVKGGMSILRLQVIVSSFFALLIAGIYLVTVFAAQEDSSIIYDLFGRTEIIAHKGYSSKAPENTMPAFELADACEDVTYIELDVWSTKDGIPVVIHNSSIKEATGVDRYVYDCTYEELQQIPAPYHMDLKDFPDARVPGLEEVIARYASSTPLLIEIKGYKQDPELPAKIVALMKKYNCEYTSLIHSGNYDAITAVKQIDPDIQCGLILAMVTGNYYDLPYADFFSIEHTFVSQNTVAQLHRRGKKVFAWTVNYANSASDLRFTDVDGLITDVPEEIVKYVSDTNQLLDSAVFRDLTGETDPGQAVENFENGNY